ncbi:glycoside hydrolase family 36 protein [Penicillium lagena]|uniref:glycoside hydrolase family 36 protein n=1 Tax=Penicillium lagena TaxID=94218 RepID=UPI0025412E67|nr:glycoside hydrolase family 36 protein [Penicillium lagena]KAJ5612769.1 glycoside hydrolase family 36 protein [Penicillium lagena]
MTRRQNREKASLVDAKILDVLHSTLGVNHRTHRVRASILERQLPRIYSRRLILRLFSEKGIKMIVRFSEQILIGRAVCSTRSGRQVKIIIFLDIITQDLQIGLRVRSRHSVFDGIQIFHRTTSVENKGPKDVHFQVLASLLLGNLNRGTKEGWHDYEIVIANNNSFKKVQWQSFNFSDIGMDEVGESDFERPRKRAAVVKSNIGTFSTNGWLPMGALTRKSSWQIEHSGAWQWELGIRNIVHGLYLDAGGPTDQNHQWTQILQPGEEFTSVTTVLAVVAGDAESAFVLFTQYRGRIRRRLE